MVKIIQMNFDVFLLLTNFFLSFCLLAENAFMK